MVVKNIKGKILKKLKTKYAICTYVFLFFFIILDNNGVSTTYSLRKNNKMLKKQKVELEESIKTDSLNYVKMCNDTAEIERFGRENYFMKRDNEEIFIVKRDN
ncbi:MAG: septum formation initiator family protein [Bacteroidales bacterium]|nr:septum formation initiator family protein [Bacteroidales bacterium]